MGIEKIDKLNLVCQLNGLYDLARDYRTSERFYQMMRFCAKMRHLKPYNAMLAYIQMPGAVYVMYNYDWEKLGRILKPNARPIVILNFKPVGVIYDISDTMTDPEAKNKYNDQRIMDEIESMNSIARMNNKSVDLDLLYRNLNLNGIAVDDRMLAGSSYSAKIELLKNPILSKFELTKKNWIKYDLPYLLSINHHASEGETINSVIHELAHLFCCHLPFPKEWITRKKILSTKTKGLFEPWTVRTISHEAREIEAESVAWIVCAHIGIVTKSEIYISSYLKDSTEMPKEVSFDAIFKAANYILDFFSWMNYRSGLLYKYDRNFADYIKK